MALPVAFPGLDFIGCGQLCAAQTLVTRLRAHATKQCRVNVGMLRIQHLPNVHQHLRAGCMQNSVMLQLLSVVNPKLDVCL